ncbi:MAG: flavin reductase family protein [Pigmentiphaga sp.]|uniref:flavin reductase family protein n=1 Tax=Pigmentiphaga sp. TaxID=1977564 RepID=UPI003B554768
MIPSADSFKAAMRRVPSAVAIVGAAHQGERRGLIATAVCSVSAEPPQLLVCVNKRVRAHDHIRLAGHFGVSYLSQDQGDIAQAFAAPAGAPEDRFRTGDWTSGSTGAPLLRQALAAFECRVAQAIDCGTHTIYIGEIVALAQKDDLSLLYKSGLFSAA